MKNKSTATEHLEMFIDFQEYLKSNKSIDVIFIDFAKAFDSVIHKKLLIKLSHIGIKGRLLNWIEAFLINRTQQVKINDEHSDSSIVTSGVPQGSVLGPLLFLIFINDLPSVISNNVKIKIFADDIKIYYPISNLQDHQLLQTALDSISVWSNDWQLPISVTKCSVLHIGKHNKQLKYTLNKVVLPSSDNCKDLGIILEPSLQFDEYIKQIRIKANQKSNLILKYFRSRNKSLLTRAFKTYVRPIVEYNTFIWNPHLNSDIDKIEYVQKNFTKRLFGKHSSISYENRLDNLNLQSLKERRIMNDL